MGHIFYQDFFIYFITSFISYLSSPFNELSNPFVINLTAVIAVKTCISGPSASPYKELYGVGRARGGAYRGVAKDTKECPSSPLAEPGSSVSPRIPPRLVLPFLSW